MRSNVPVLAGLVSGVLLAALLIVAIVVFAPDPVAAPGSSPAVGAFGTAAASPAATPSGGSAAVTEAPNQSGDSSANFRIGQPAPPLRLAKVGGGTFDLAEMRGKPVWVNFMRTDCPPCIDEFPLMNGFAVRYSDTGLTVVAVDIRESEAVAGAFARSLEAQFPVALDTDGAAQEAWQAIVLPVHFWIDAGGIVRDGALGGIGPDLMARGLSTILPGVTVNP